MRGDPDSCPSVEGHPAPQREDSSHDSFQRRSAPTADPTRKQGDQVSIFSGQIAKTDWFTITVVFISNILLSSLAVTLPAQTCVC